jgi:peptidoglycan/LPS O-acetylase OafA/YrhL
MMTNSKMAAPGGERRWPGLDVLRATAVLLIVFRHFDDFAAPGSVGDLLLRGTMWIGWAGVDLFFALSGFLISNLLFEEFRATGGVRSGRFLTRRAFKIYPGFYVLIAVTAALWSSSDGWELAKNALAEIFFVQNYFYGLWLHTWSLAVEEHFYLLITLLFVLPWRGGIVKRWPWVVGIVAVGCLAGRVATGLSAPFYYDTHLQRTHLRLDGLFLGSLAAYLFNFYRSAVLALIAQQRRAYNLVTAAALMIPFAAKLETSFFEQTLGITILAIGCSMLTLGCVGGAFEFRLGAARRTVEKFGRCSYAIYLWHLPVAMIFLPEVQSYVWFRIPAPVMFLIYVSGSLCMGIAMTRWVEAPCLRLRERWFPRAGTKVQPTTPTLAVA